MSSLTQMYTDAVLRHVPEDSKDEIAQDVRAMIADMSEARLADRSGAAVGGADAQAGDRPVEASVEREVLEELGDPVRLAREYSRAPQHLIGPEWYPVFRWAMQWLLPLVGAAALLVNGIVYSLTEPVPHLGGLIGTAIGKSVQAVLIAFATITVLLAVVERVTPGGGRRFAGTGREGWTVDQLEEGSATGGSLKAEAVVSIVILILLAAVPLLPTSLLYVGHLNDGETFVNPDLATGWIVGYWALLAGIAATGVWKAARGRLTAGPVLTGAVIDVLLAVFLTVAFSTQDVMHPAFPDGGLIDGPLLTALTVAVIWAITIWDQICTFRAYRARR